MRLLIFSGRNVKEILRDPLNLVFGLGFPIILLLLLSAIQANIPVSLFEPERLAPGMAVFGCSFLTLFSATLLAKDRESAFLQRLYTTPLRASDYIFGYLLPVIPIAAAQCAICYFAAILIGLPATISILYAALFIIPVSLFYIAVGLLCGSIFNVKQVGGICGALFVNLAAWFSGVWFDLELVGGAFQKIANMLPFLHAVELEKAVLNGNWNGIFPHIYWVAGYSTVLIIAAVLLFFRQMRKV